MNGVAGGGRSEKSVDEAERERHLQVFVSSETSGPLLQEGGRPIQLGDIGTVADVGLRGGMEDAHFWGDFGDKGYCMGVFDGHGGGQVANLAARLIPNILGQLLNRYHPYTALEGAFAIFQNVLEQLDCSGRAGSTAVVSVVDRRNGQIWTATIGDSETHIYRRTDRGALQAIPLSCVRNWASPKDYPRCKEYLGGSEEHRLKHRGNGAKYLRSPEGTNVSRAFGDLDDRGSEEQPTIISKPKITLAQLQPGDTLMLACDGLRDYAPGGEPQIMEALGAWGSAQDRAQRVADCSLRNPAQFDNVTVMVMDVMGAAGQ